MKKLLLFWILIFSLQIFAQESPQAVKFDAYNESEEVSVLEAKTNKFLEQLAKEPKTTKGYVYWFEAEIIFNKESKIRKLSKHIKSLVDKKSLDQEVSILLAGRERNLAKIEFWIVPKYAKLPDYNPDRFCFMATCICPNVLISGEESVNSKTQSITFSVEITPLDEELTAKFEWSVSKGKIISGQGTNQIKVDISDVNYGDSVTATVEASGSVFCDGNCQRTVSFTTILKNK